VRNSGSPRWEREPILLIRLETAVVMTTRVERAVKPAPDCAAIQDRIVGADRCGEHSETARYKTEGEITRERRDRPSFRHSPLTWDTWTGNLPVSAASTEKPASSWKTRKIDHERIDPETIFCARYRAAIDLTPPSLDSQSSKPYGRGKRCGKRLVRSDPHR
jgi:hypothetical protein